MLGDDRRIPKGRGKPAGDIYEVALETVNQGMRERGEREISKEECLVFEDSVPGVEAGRRAGMRVIWCPHKELLKEYRGREEQVLAGLMGEHKQEKDEVKGALEVAGAERRAKENWVGEGAPDEGKVEGSGRARERMEGWPGRVGDGWGELLDSLERFPYERYGIQIASGPTSSS